MKHVTPIDLNKNELQNPRAQNLGADPGSPVEGQFFWRTDTKTWRVYNGTAWIDLGAATGAVMASLVDAKGDLLVGTANDTVARKAVGADNTFLVAASGQSDGLQWRALTAADMQEKIATADLTDWPRTADLDLASHKLTSVTDGTANTDAATVGQLNAAIEGRKWKDTVDAATTAALPALTYNAGAGTLTATANAALGAQDGVTLGVNDDLLVKNQASTFQNGIYTVTQVGSGAAPFILTRRADASTATELSDATVIIEGGASNQGDIYTQTSALADLTAAAQTWTKTGEGNTVYTADGTTIVLTGNSFGVPNGGITGTQLAASVAGAGLTGGGGSALAVGAGTGVSVAADTVGVDTAVVARKYTALVGNGALTSITVNHALGNQWVTVQVIEVSSLAVVVCDVVLTDANNVTLTFATAPASNAYRVIVVG